MLTVGAVWETYQLMDGTSTACFFLRKDTRGQLSCCVRVAEEGMFLLRGSKQKCCFPLKSPLLKESDIK